MDFLEETIFLSNSLLSWGYFLSAFIMTFALSHLVTRIIVKILEKTSSKTKNHLDNMIKDIISAPLRLTITTLGLYASFYLIDIHGTLEEIIHNILNSLIIFSIFWFLHRGVDAICYSLTHLSDKLGKKLSDEIINFMATSLNVLIFIIGMMTIIQQWGFNVSSFVASLGLGGLAFALAAKDTAANLFGSLVIFIDKPFNVGDWIKTPDVEGTIVEIGIRSTKIRTFAQAITTVPNANLANAAIINWSRMGKRRIKTTLGLTYGTTPAQINAILEDLKEYLLAHDAIDDETIFINFSGFGESTLDIFCYFFTKTIVWGEFMEVQEEVFLEFMRIITEKHKASFAFPSRSIYLEKETLN